MNSQDKQQEIRCFADQVQQMSREQAQEFLLMLYQQIMMKEMIYQHFLKDEWKLDSGLDYLLN